MEKIIVNPLQVRGLGNIVSSKNSSDFGLVNCSISTSSATINGLSETVYTNIFRQGEHIILQYNYFEAYTENLNYFTVRATLYQYNSNVYVGKDLTCTVNDDLVLTGRTNSRGQVVFNIPVDSEGVYYFRVDYTGTSNQGNIGCSQNGRVIVGELDNILLQSQVPITSKNNDTALFATVTGTVNDEVISIPGTVVNFYEEYNLFKVTLTSSLGNIIQDDDVTTLTAKVTDEDGSAIPDQTVSFYEEYESGSLVFTNTETAITSGDELTLSALLRNVEGGRINGETVSFYEEYTADDIKLTSDKDVIVEDETATLSASLRDRDGSIIRSSGTTIKFYEKYDLSNILVSSSTPVIEDGDEINISILVTDEDGSRIPNATVTLYEEFDYTNLEVSSSKNPLVGGDEITVSALFTDEDGSRVRDAIVDFEADVPSTDWSMELDADETIIQNNGTLEVTATVTDSNEDEVEDIFVRFYAEGDNLPEEIIIPARTTMTLLASSSSFNIGGSTVLSCTVLDSDNEPISGETVSFYDGTTLIGSDETDSDGIASYTYTPAAAGVHSLKATYDTFTSNIVSVTVNKISTSLSLSATSTGLTYGDNLVLSGTLSNGGSGQSIKIYNGTTLVDTVTTTSGGAFSKTVSGLSVGSYSFKAVFEGTSSLANSESSALAVTVSKITSTISLTGSNITYGSNVSLSGTLSVGSGKSVKIYQGTTLLDTVTTTTDGAFSKTVSGLGAGSYTFKAVYEGDSTHTSVEATKSITVSKATPTISLSATSTSISVGDTLALSGTLSLGSGKSVKIYRGTTLVDTVTTGASGAFSKNVTGLSAGSYTFKATYDGDANYNSVDSSGLSVTVSASVTPSSIELTSDKSVLSYYDNESATLTATVTGSDSNPMAGQTVSMKVYDSNNTLKETLTVTDQNDGTYTASYSSKGAGDLNIKAECMNLQETYSIEDCFAYVTDFSDWDTVSNKGVNFRFSDFTLPTNHEIKFKLNGNGTVHIAIGDKTTVNASGYLMWIYAWYLDNKRCYTRTSSNGETTTNLTYTTNNNVEYCIQYNGTTLKLYQSGSLITTLTSYDPLNLTRLLRIDNSYINNISYVKVKSL